MILSVKALAAGLLIAATQIDPTPVDQQRAEMYFREAKELCDRDNGRLWGVSLCGPMVFTDARTQTIATSQPPPDGARPGGLGFVNAPVTWGGERWSAYMWAFISPTDARARGRLFIHELFHRVQPELKLIAGAGENDHLDTLDGRYWLQLEWRALSRALTSSGGARAAAISDALAFRRARRTAFPGGTAPEVADEIREGLPSYTGAVVAAPSTAEAVVDAVAILANAEQDVSFVRTFAYMSGPAYGLLLDAFASGWTRRVTAADDLALMLAAATKIEPAANAAASASRYRGAELRATEEKRDAVHQARIAVLKQRFVDGPVLTVPRPKSAAVNNTGATAIPAVGMVIMEYRSTPEWGTLAATSGVLLPTNGDVLHLTTPFKTSGSTLSGDGWSITLAEGWMVRPGTRLGDFEVVRKGK